ncbi:MAG: DNA topoisomerase VI subunit B, partial [Candidatus Binatota bacterium]
FLRRREHAKSEFRRRNIFELYIEEVVDACNRLKGGKLAKEKLKNQLQKIAMKRTGGEKTDELLGHDGDPEGLPHSIIVTPEGTEGEAPDMRNDLAPPEEALDEEDQSTAPTQPKGNAGSTKSTMTGRKKAAKVKQQSGPKRDSRKQTAPRSGKDKPSAKRRKR